MRKNRIRYLSFVIITWTFVYFFGGRVPYMMAHIMLVMPIISLIHLFISYNTIKYTQTLSIRAPMKGDSVDYIEYIVNESIIPSCYFEILHFSTKHLTGFDSSKKEFWFAPKQNFKEVQNIKFAHRGIYEFGSNEIIFTDLLGIFRFRRRLDESIKTRVLPKIYKIFINEIQNDKDSDSQVPSRKSFEDLSHFDDVRKYQYGDSIKRIYWKMSAKYRELLVKNYSGISKSSITMLIDLQPLSGDFERVLLNEDKIIESALSILKTLSDQYERIEIIFFDKNMLNVVHVTTPQDFISFYNTLALKDFNSNFSVSQLIESIILNNISSGNLIIISASLDMDFLGRLIDINIKGHKTKFILCDDLEGDKEKEELIEDIKSNGVSILESSKLINFKGVEEYV